MTRPPSTRRSRKRRLPGSRRSRSMPMSPTRTPTTCTTTRSSTRSLAPSGCSTSSAARARSTTCAAWPATPPTPTKLINDFLASGQYDTIQGIWTSGMDSMVVDAIKAAHKPFVPIVGADLGAFVKQLLDPVGYPGLKGVAVTNTAAVGGAGIALALKLLKGEAVTTDPSASQPNTVLLKPVAVDNLTDDGKAKLKSWQSVPGLDPNWPLGITIDGWTTYTPAQAIACKGPGE